LATNFLYESYSPVGNLYFKEGDLHLKERLIRVVVHPLQNEAEVMATLRECYFEIGEAIESAILYQVAA
jgi:hypothetical protein